MSKLQYVYCRYCAFCFDGDCYYCSNFEIVLTEKKIKAARLCEDYAQSELGDVITGRQYRPRLKKDDMSKPEQLSLLDIKEKDA